MKHEEIDQPQKLASEYVAETLRSAIIAQLDLIEVNPQGTLAAKLGVSQSYISKLVTAKTPISCDRLLNWCQILDLDIATTLEGMAI